MPSLRKSLVASNTADRAILETILRCGHLTTLQLYTLVHGPFHQPWWDSMRWRVRRMVHHKLLDRRTVLGLTHSVLSIAPEGASLLAGHGLCYAGPRSDKSQNRSGDVLRHDVELNDIRLALTSAGVVANWKTEHDIRALNDFTTSGYVKDFDALVVFTVDGCSREVALEYERTPKSSRQYERIVDTLRREARVQDILYLAPSPELVSFLAYAFGRARQRVWVGWAQSFSGNPAGDLLIAAGSLRPGRLRDVVAG
jgi:hypothetical protein